MGITLVEFDVCRFHSKFSATRHCIARVHCEVHDDLFHLPWVGFHATNTRLENRVEADVFSEETLQQLIHVTHDGVQVQNLWREDLLATERKELPRETGCPV